MKLFYLLLSILISFTHSSLHSTTINGRFSVVNMTSSELSILLQINTNTGTDDLGGATVAFSFDTTAIVIGDNPVKNVDYFFHNFCDGNYSPATITKPIRNQIWVNIDLPFTNNNNGTIVTAGPGWTDVVTIHFDIVDPNGAAHLDWQTTSPFWGIYDANNSTLWQIGEFTDLFGPLPVELVSFSASLLPNNTILLEWKTASSLNCIGFEIQKSYTTSDIWENIGFVESYGDPSSLIEYNYTDISSHSYPVARYRLKSIDNDGSFNYSNIIEINTAPTNFALSQNYPNPFNPTTVINYQLPVTSFVNLKVFDLLGNEITTLVSETKEAGKHSVEFQSSNLASGIYIYVLGVADFVDTKKMVLIR
jgi:hypothetical protein